MMITAKAPKTSEMPRLPKEREVAILVGVVVGVGETSVDSVAVGVGLTAVAVAAAKASPMGVAAARVPWSVSPVSSGVVAGAGGANSGAGRAVVVGTGLRSPSVTA